MNIKEAIEQAFEWSQDPGIEHFVMVLGLVDHMPLAAIAPMGETKLLTDYEDRAKIVRTLRRLADAMETQPFDAPPEQSGEPGSPEAFGVEKLYDNGKQLVKAPGGGLVLAYTTTALMQSPGHPGRGGVVVWQVDERIIKLKPRLRGAIDFGVMKAVYEALERA